MSCKPNKIKSWVNKKQAGIILKNNHLLTLIKTIRAISAIRGRF